MHVNGFKALMLKVFKLSCLRNFVTERFLAAVTKSGTGTRGRGDVGTRGRGDAGTRRIRGRDKQIAPDFCAELVKYFFFQGQM